MTIMDPIERVVLTHLQIPLKEPFRISGGEVAIKDAILVVLETSSAIGLGESSPMAASFGYPGDTPESCWDALTNTIAPSLLGRAVHSIEDIGAVASSWNVGPVRGGWSRNGPLGPARAGASRDDCRAPRCPRFANRPRD